MGAAGETGVFIATPCYGGVVTQAYMQSVLSLMTEAAVAGIPVTVGLLGQDALITRSRNTLLARFLETDCSHILFIDADIAFTAADVFRLIAADRDVVGAVYPIRAANWGPAALARLRDGEPLSTATLDFVGEPVGSVQPDGLMRARYAGTGFLMISREAIGRLVEAYPETRCRHGHVASPDGAREVFALFDCVIEPETKEYLSEDFTFCHRWRAIGGEIWLDTSARLSHCGMSEFRGDPARRWHAATS